MTVAKVRKWPPRNEQRIVLIVIPVISSSSSLSLTVCVHQRSRAIGLSRSGSLRPDLPRHRPGAEGPPAAVSLLELDNGSRRAGAQVGVAGIHDLLSRLEHCAFFYSRVDAEISACRSRFDC